MPALMAVWRMAAVYSVEPGGIGLPSGFLGGVAVRADSMLVRASRSIGATASIVTVASV